jgi:tRNA pseudouridine32 synthase/23S rRNA pseudouridine746 synthase/23S rRNA pseudouridine1911/1915/1917 synthase
MSRRSRPNLRRLPQSLSILHEDADILVVVKPPGLLTVGTDAEKPRTAYFILTEYVRGGVSRSRNRIFIVHRLDRETSGILVFARSEAAKRHLQDHWDETKKHYLAVVHGRCEKDSDVITSYLAENRAYGVYSTTNPAQGKLSRTGYRVLKRTPRFSLLEIDLLTGRKHQIRVHLAGIGHPVVGDRRYGPPDKKHRQLALHAQQLAFTHPVTGEPVVFEAEPPEYFSRLVGRVDPPRRKAP